MKNYIMYALSLLLMATACNDDDTPTAVVPAERGTVTDDLGNSYEWVRIGDLDWTTSNAKNGFPCYDISIVDSWGWEDYLFGADEAARLQEEYIPAFGNLMSYDDAVGSAPEGWRLPTDEDWKNLERALGMGGEVENIGWRGSGVGDLMRQGADGTDLNMKNGGCIMRSSLGYSSDVWLYHEKEYGYYWTSTVDESYTTFKAAYYRKLSYGVDKVERRAASTLEKYMSVRWVRDAK